MIFESLCINNKYIHYEDIIVIRNLLLARAMFVNVIYTRKYRHVAILRACIEREQTYDYYTKGTKSCDVNIEGCLEGR